MMRSAVALAIASASAVAQAPGPSQTRLSNVLPAGVRATQLAITPDARRVYYGDSARAIWLYDRTDKRNVRLVDGEAWDLTVSPVGNAIAYKRTPAGSPEQHVWVLPLDARTGLASGSERRASGMQGDTPAISADGKWLAFATDDSAGVGQGLVIVPIAGGPERVIVPALHASVSNIKWSPDGHSLYYGLNPPVACDPDWSCLPLRKEFMQTTGSIHRIAVDDASSARKSTTASARTQVIAAKVGNFWPGLAADGSLLAFGDTTFSGRLIVADTNGNQLGSVPLVPRQTIEGWLNASTLVFSDRGDIRRLHSYAIADSSSRVLIDSLEQVTEPSWSPDGATLATIHCPPTSCSLRLSHADGSLIRTIDLPERYGAGNLWSGDQQRIAYVSAPVNNERYVNVVELSTGQVRRLTTLHATASTVQLWEPDSRGLVVSAVLGAGATRHAIFQRVDLDGTTRILRDFVVGATPSGGLAIDANTVVLYSAGEMRRAALTGDSTQTVLLPKSARAAGYVAVAPGAGRLAFRRTGDSEDEVNVLDVISPDGSNEVTIDTPFEMLNGINTLRFLPGGTQLVVMGAPWRQDSGIGVYLVSVATKSIKKLFSVPISVATGELSLSPDGRTVLYVTNEISTPRVFTMDLSSLRANSRR
jgi:Tol biopolymer transport system component